MDLDLITRALAGAASAADRRRLEAWLATSAERAELFDAMRVTAAETDVVTPADRLEALLASAKQPRVAVADDEERPPLRVVDAREVERRWKGMEAAPRSWLHGAARAAAILLVATGAIAAGWLALRSNRAPDALATSADRRVVTTTRGQRVAFRLPDGTLAVLAPSTTLRLVPGYGGATRTVEVEGQAAFTVVHDDVRPFIVRAAGLVIRDVGTRFAMRGYPGDSIADVVVAEGVVVVSAGASDSLTLLRGDRAHRTVSGALAVTHGVPVDRFFAWTEGRLVFQETPLRDVIAQLNRWYDVDITLAPSTLGAKQVSASTADEPVGDVLGMLAVSLGLSLTHDGRHYTLSQP